MAESITQKDYCILFTLPTKHSYCIHGSQKVQFHSLFTMTYIEHLTNDHEASWSTESLIWDTLVGVQWFYHRQHQPQHQPSSQFEGGRVTVGTYMYILSQTAPTLFPVWGVPGYCRHIYFISDSANFLPSLGWPGYCRYLDFISDSANPLPSLRGVTVGIYRITHSTWTLFPVWGVAGLLKAYIIYM